MGAAFMSAQRYIACIETEACKRCGEGEAWGVKGPNGLFLDPTYCGEAGKASAEVLARLLNETFEFAVIDRDLWHDQAASVQRLGEMDRAKHAASVRNALQAVSEADLLLSPSYTADSSVRTRLAVASSNLLEALK
jgi:hypothetical protein